MSEQGNDPSYPVHAPGWASLDRAMGMIYPEQTPHQFASQRAYDLEGTTPLPAVSVYEVDEPSHWHYISYGLTELFEKSSPNPEQSGFGFELTLRVRRTESDQTPPMWGVTLLQALGHYVLSGHGPLDSGHIIDLGGPLIPSDASADNGGPPTQALEGVVCIPDPRLGKLDTVHGSVLFLLLFGLTRDELEPMSDWNLGRKVGLVQEAQPLGIIDPQRGSMREDRRKAALFRRYELGIMID